MRRSAVRRSASPLCYVLVGLAVLVGVLALPGAAGLPGLGRSLPVAVADPPTPAPPPQTLCTTGDRRLAELSGLATDGGTGRWAITDGARARVHQLGEDCTVRGTRPVAVDATDVEDLVRTPDGTLWLADIGDNERVRDTVAVHTVGPDGRVTTYRLRYPDGPHDAEALLVGRDRVPVLVTKEVLAAPGVYRPEGSPDANGVTPLRRVGVVSLPDSGTPGGSLGGFGSLMVTGGATTANGTVAAVRTYTDAWLFAAPDGDVAAALAGTPVRVPLPDEPQGEAIAFEADGALLSGSERHGGVSGELRRVPGAVDLLRNAVPEGAASPQATAAGEPHRSSDRLGASPGTLTAGAGALATLAVALLLLRRVARRSRRAS